MQSQSRNQTTAAITEDATGARLTPTYLKKARQQLIVPDIEKHYTAYRILQEINTPEALTGSRCKRQSTIIGPFLQSLPQEAELQTKWPLSQHHVALFTFLNIVLAIKSS